MDESDIKVAVMLFICGLTIITSGIGAIAAGFGGCLVGLALPITVICALALSQNRREVRAEKARKEGENDA